LDSRDDGKGSFAPQRQTALLAKQACELQNLSQGRLRLGVGVGWNWVEFEALNCNFEDRGKVIEEQVELMQLLWTKDLVTYRGRYHTIDRAAIAPRPTSPIPIWFGGYTSRSLKRSFQLGVGHIFGHFNDEILALARQIRQLENGNVRGQFPLQMEAIFDYSRPPETWAASVTEWQKVGGTDLSIRTMATRNVEPSGCTTVKDHLDAFECWRNHLVAEGLW
jgi:hypothetical protein